MAFTGTISHEGDIAPPQDVLDAAVHCAEQVRAQRDALGIARLIKAFDLADGSQAYVLDMEHVWKVHIIPPFDQPTEDQPTEIDRIKILDEPIVTIAGLVSGGAGPTTLDYHSEDEEEGRPWSGWYVKNDAVSLMPETAELFSRPEVAYKVGVLENPIFAPFDRILSEHVYSQFATTEPGNYTGAMRSIVQLLLGVAKMLDRDYEQRWLEADPERTPLVLQSPDPFREEFDEVDIPTSFYSGEGLKEIQISYDRHWNRTHGVMWGRDQENRRVPMLVELGQRGIYVMPFPVDELSKLPEVQAHYKRVYPDLERFTPFWNDTADLFEAFNGFPTGERMAGVKAELDRQVRAGWVMEANRDLSAFYSGVPMCTGFGWAFHEEASRAINTMYTYNQLGQKIGWCYEVRMDITEKPDSLKVRNTVFAQLIAVLGLSDPVDRFKAERIDQDTAEGLLQSGDYEEFDAYEVTPDWWVRASVVPIRQGFIEYPAKQCPSGGGPFQSFQIHPLQPPMGGGGSNADPCDIIGSPHFKYYEPLLGIVLNFTFEKGKDVPNPRMSDGPIFASFVNGSAEILNYFYDYTPISTQREEWNTRQPCQYVGTWEFGYQSQGAGNRGYFYTSSRDYRELANFSGGSRTKVDGSIVGNYDFMAFCAFFASHSFITKRYIGDQRSERITWSSTHFNVSVSCASNNRSMFFVCREERESERSPYKGYSSGYIGSSGARKHGSIYNFVWHWTGVCRTPRHLPFGNPVCTMVVSEGEVVDPMACLGTAMPTSPVYSVCCIRDGEINACGGTAGQQNANEWVCMWSGPSQSDGCQVIQSADVTRRPTTPPDHGSGGPTTRRHKYEIRAFGHPLLHDRVIHEYEEESSDPQSWIRYVSDSHWWRCSLEDCRAPPWRVVANYYGPPYVATNREFDFGWVEFGRKPQVTGRFFGVVH